MEDILALLGIFFFIPSCICGMIYFGRRGKRRLELAELAKQTAILELEREKTKLMVLEAENKKYDRFIESRLSDAEKS